MHPYSFLAATQISSVIIWGSIIAVIAVVGGVAIMTYRHHVLSKDAEQAAPGFTLEELRKLRDRGELSEAEYEIARNRMGMAVKKSASAKPKGEKS